MGIEEPEMVLAVEIGLKIIEHASRETAGIILFGRRAFGDHGSEETLVERELDDRTDYARGPMVAVKVGDDDHIIYITCDNAPFEVCSMERMVVGRGIATESVDVERITPLSAKRIELCKRTIGEGGISSKKGHTMAKGIRNLSIRDLDERVGSVKAIALDVM